MILWFGKKKKKEALEAEGKRIEAEEAAAAELVEAEAQAEAEAKRVAAEQAEAEAAQAFALAKEATERMAAEEAAAPDAPEPVPEAALEDLPEVIAHAASPEDNAFDLDNMPAIVSQPDAPVEPDNVPEAEAQKPGFFSKLSSGLKRSSSKLSDGITGVFTKRKLDEKTLEELEDLLIMSDLGTAVARKVTANIAKDRFEKEIGDDEIKAALASEIAQIMAPREKIVDFADGPRPRVVLFVGVNGSGKTTTIGKIASRLKAQGAKALLVAGDTFRAAAIEQLTVWGERAGIPVVSGKPEADAAGLVYSAIEQAQREGLDLVLVDTAGRLQNKSELMSELAKVVRVIQKLDPDAPHDVILVLDATVGQNALSQVEAFRHTANVTGLVMTKLDGTAKGGVLVAVAEAHELPIHFVGVGESAEDLQAFSADAYARALVGLEGY